MDIDRFRVFNTNNVWVDLIALERSLEQERLNLPIIRNRKTIGDSTIIQLETAMGAAVGSFARSKGLRVGRAEVAGCMNDPNRMVLRNLVQIVSGRVSFFSNQGVVIPAPAYPLSLGCFIGPFPENLDQVIHFGDLPHGRALHVDPQQGYSSVFLEMIVGFDQSGKHRLPL